MKLAFQGGVIVQHILQVIGSNNSVAIWVIRVVKDDDDDDDWKLEF